VQSEREGTFYLTEISEKVQKSLMTPIMNRLHRYGMLWRDRKIHVIISHNLCNQESVQ
jgi:hypothetical protein